MPYEMVWEARGLYRRYYGRGTDQEVLDSARLTESSERYDELRYVILDFLDVEEVTLVNPAFIREITAQDFGAALSNPCIKFAVVTRHPEIRRLAREYATHPLCSYPLQIFDTVADARAWVKVELPCDYQHTNMVVKPA